MAPINGNNRVLFHPYQWSVKQPCHMLKVFKKTGGCSFFGITPSPPWHGNRTLSLVGLFDQLEGWELLRLDAQHARMIRDQDPKLG